MAEQPSAGRNGDHRVVVIGAGIGGLVAALMLACRGLQVTLLDAQPEPGGKLRRVMVDGAAIDAGPTVFTMRWVFEQILAEAGSTLDEQLQLEPLSILARHAWRGQAQRLDLFADPARSIDAIAEFSGPAEARRFAAFLAEARRLYAALEQPYIRSERPGLARMLHDLGPRGLSVLSGLGPFATMWRALGRRFADPRLQQLFARYATYCGSSPWLAPATLLLVAQVEFDGVWSIRGGMHELARVLAGLAERRGARLRMGCAAQQIEMRHGRVCSVRLSTGESLPADSVIFNGDVAALATGLLGAPAAAAVPPQLLEQRSLSAVTWALHAQTSGFPLVRHNVFFDDDYRSEFTDILRRRSLPARGTVYVCAQDRGGDAASSSLPLERERLLALVNAPAAGDTRPFDDSEVDPCEYRSLALLRSCGLSLTLKPQQALRSTPHDFHRLFPATGGALYGPATHGWMAAFRRPGSRTALPGLYLAGGSVHPGPGVPMAAMSGRLAAATLLAHLDSTSRSRRVVISGGISTRSAATAGML